jgi:hypothetical protein
VREAEEFPLLETVTRERLVKTQQAGKCLVGAVVICELWRLAIAIDSVYSHSHHLTIYIERYKIYVYMCSRTHPLYIISPKLGVCIANTSFDINLLWTTLTIFVITANGFYESKNLF